MPFYNEPRLIESARLTLDDTDVSFWDYIRASAGDAWNDNPATDLKRTGDIYMAQVGEDTVADLAMQNGLSIDLDHVEFTGSPALSLDEQTRIIKDSGLEGHVKAQEGYNAEALNIVMQNKQDEIDRALTREQAPAWMAPFGFATGLGVSIIDPINIASSFVPVIGEQRVMRMLASASGAGGRAAVRAGVGAVEGAVGAAMVEPLVYLAKNQQQADYGMTDSVLNIAFGAVMGGAMHSAAGAWGDWVRSRRGDRHPWEIVSPNDLTEHLRLSFADDLFSAAEQAGASITREQADLTSSLFDIRARTWAYDEGLSVQDYYDRYRPDFRSSDQIKAGKNADERVGISNISILYQDADDNWVYRGSNSSDTPYNDVGHAMWASGESERVSSTYASNDYSRMWGLNISDLPDIQDFYDDIRKAFEESKKNDTFPGDMGERYQDVEDLLELIDPDDIVDTAGVWDDLDAVQWLWDEVFYKKNIGGVKLYDGAITFEGYPQRIVNLGEELFSVPDMPEPTTDRAVATYHGLSPEEALEEEDSLFQTAGRDASLYQFFGAQGVARMDIAEEVTTRMDNLSVARTMESAGKDAKTIKLATGWERGADGKWRYEIDDSVSSYYSEGDANTRRWHPDYVKYQDLQLKNIDALLGKAEWTAQDEKDLYKLNDIWGNEIGRRRDLLDDGQAVLEDMLIHEELFNAYPELRRIPVRFAEEQGAMGAYRGKTQGITLSPGRSEKETFSTLMHEIQHAIQEQEGFARGGSPDEMRDRAIAQVQERLSNLERGDDIRMLMEMEDGTFFDEVPAGLRPIFQEKLEELRQTITPEEVAQYREIAADMDYESVSEAAFDLYRQLMGEVEARNVQTRIGMTMDERLASLASETEDVAREDQIFLENTLRAAMAEEAPSGPKAAVTFDAAEDAKAIISFFQSADVTSAPHEIYHIFRRELAETAMAEGASEKSRQMWRQACEFVGAEPGQAWTREMEEKFALAGERFLTEGVAPRPDLQGLFEKMRQWFLEIYTAVESAGVELSDGMRRTFGDMLALSPEESDAAFRYGLGRLIEQSPVEGMNTSVQPPMDDKAAPAEVLAALQDDSVARLNEAISYTSNLPPEDLQILTDNFNAEMAAIDAVISAEEARAQIMREAALCDLRR